MGHMGVFCVDCRKNRASYGAGHAGILPTQAKVLHPALLQSQRGGGGVLFLKHHRIIGHNKIPAESCRFSGRGQE